MWIEERKTNLCQIIGKNGVLFFYVTRGTETSIFTADQRYKTAIIQASVSDEQVTLATQEQFTRLFSRILRKKVTHTLM